MTLRIAYALLGALVCAAAAVLTWAVAFRTGLGHAADARVLSGLAAYQQTRVEPLAQLVAVICNPVPYAALAATVTGAALLRAGARGAAVVAAILVIPNAITQVLKGELAEDRSGVVAAQIHVEAAAWPSGHATAAMSLAIALVLITPGAWRYVAGLAGGAFVLAMAFSVVLLGWHFPSDALGGIAIAGAGGCLGAALLSRRAATTALPGRWRLARG